MSGFIIENGVLKAYEGADAHVVIPDGVTSIGSHAFYNCKRLTSVTIPVGVTSIGERAFSGCRSLASVTLSAGVTSIGKRAFYACISLTSVTIPDSVTSIGNYAFWDCSSLTSVTIPAGVTSIGDLPFAGCYRLKSISLPDQWAGKLDSLLPRRTRAAILHTPDSAPVSAQNRPGAAVCFAGDGHECTDENGEKDLK